ncbi:MAG TPA: hypothetical protein VK181_00095 [Rhizobium sp.]|nr:hypothetical protein [Rhizobium sp.]
MTQEVDTKFVASRDAAMRALQEFANALTRQIPAGTTLTNQTGNWQSPPIHSSDLAIEVQIIAKEVEELDSEDADPELRAFLEKVPDGVKQIRNGHIYSHLFNGNFQLAYPALKAFLDSIHFNTQRVLSKRSSETDKRAPSELRRRLRAVRVAIDTLENDTTDLRNSALLINSAREAAESLPVDLQELKDARKSIEATRTAIEITESESKAKLSIITEYARKLIQHEEEAKRVLKAAEDAYRSATSTGLAAAFDASAGRLRISIWFWVATLLAALASAYWIGHTRLGHMQSLLSSPDPRPVNIWCNLLLSALSLGAPIWFAWLATKQIQHRFRLSEDYAYKAALSRAYEGYQREAAKIDPEFSARLFNTALTRLDELPLRLIDERTHGSPWHEFVESEAFKEALAKIPGLRERFSKLDRKKSNHPQPKRETAALRNPETETD